MVINGLCKTYLQLHCPFYLNVESHMRVKRVQCLAQGGEWLMLLQFFIKEALAFLFPFCQMVNLKVIMNIVTLPAKYWLMGILL